MVLDKEDHRVILKQLLDNSQFPGKFAEEVVALKAAINNAEIAAEPAVKPKRR
jgi:hypothetical protein